jgi:hypothetical protein
VKRCFEEMPPGVATGDFKIMLELLVAAQHAVQGIALQAGHLVFEIAQAVGEGVQVGKRLLGLVEDGVVVVEDRVLAEVTDADAAREGDDAGIGLQFSDEEPEKAGLAGPVVSDQADALATVNLEVEPVEQGSRAEGLLNVLE